ncbi:hypothetical protein [Snodgrassella alvi]|uniref:Lipoprotein n=1 Tax=Snodgrassella alvi TaxID=1196083 RepID=A0ABD7Z257_9NEIS|nr:hypothetical protein [Snodgrassella alvi]AHN29641.1 hypothetical protein SALWKB2_2259 [Snodgrassella alvi wkB2]UOO99453.1 hypothetical protein LVJ87_04410 [Snodgrassella alvi wkB2]WLS98679.1 hypothetical protein RAM05_01280 [Snodgrassella alvi]WLT02499.1 hypothetical protein RAM00_01245 [Snodgrassella alvi]
MKKFLSLGLLCSLLALAGCASDGSGKGQTQVYGDIKTGVETSHTSH